MEQQTCPKCGFVLQPLQTVCPRCMAQVSGPQPAAQPSPLQPQPPVAILPAIQTQPPVYMPPPIPQMGDQEIKDADSKAVIALILGIANFVVCGLLWIGALILGGQALEIYDRRGYQGGNRGMAVVARILGWVGMAFLILGLLAVVAAILIPAMLAATHGVAQP